MSHRGYPPATKVTVGKNEIYHWKNLVRPFLVHKFFGRGPPTFRYFPDPRTTTQHTHTHTHARTHARTCTHTAVRQCTEGYPLPTAVRHEESTHQQRVVRLHRGYPNGKRMTNKVHTHAHARARPGIGLDWIGLDWKGGFCRLVPLQLLGTATAQTAPTTSSTAPAHQPLGSANAETTPAGAPAAAADETQRPDAIHRGKNG